MKRQVNQTKKDLIRNFLYLILGIFWIYGSVTDKFVRNGTNLLLILIGIALIVLGILGIRKYYLQKNL